MRSGTVLFRDPRVGRSLTALMALAAVVAAHLLACHLEVPSAARPHPAATAQNVAELADPGSPAHEAGCHSQVGGAVVVCGTTPADLTEGVVLLLAMMTLAAAAGWLTGHFRRWPGSWRHGTQRALGVSGGRQVLLSVSVARI